MNLKLALIENDTLYRDKFINAFFEFYPQIEIYSFSDIEKAVELLSYQVIDIAIVSEDIYNLQKNMVKALPCKAVLIALDSAGISQVDDLKATCKYQRIDHLQQAIMDLYLENSGGTIGSSGNGRTRLITFMSGAGGSGCSTSAAAYAAYLAGNKEKVLYIDFNTFGIPDLLFSDTGNYTMTNCILAVIEQKKNLAVQLKNFARQDVSGVYYYAACDNALDWLDFTSDNLETMIESLVSLGEYDYIIMDIASEWDKTTAYFADNSELFLIVTNGTTVSNKKAQRVWETADTYFRAAHKDFSKLYVLYSAFAQNAKTINDERIKEFRTLPFLSAQHGVQELVRSLSAKQYWE
ncbi:MAG: AAA family ATPase [Ruminococcus sp.]|nr:AAA family ATPase [Ruminococcus sp.]